MQRIKDFGKLIKFRVNIIVVISSIFGYLIGTGGDVTALELLGLSFGGFFTTGAAHAINQIFERKYDLIMDRTKDRPLPTGRMTKFEVMVYAIVMTVVGAILFLLFTNDLTLIIGMSSLLIYSFIYTPLKRKTQFSVIVGAIPGALPPTIGYVAATGVIDKFSLLLFLFQFIWQFPHFWSIAWIYNDDYTNAGYDLLPTKKGRTNLNAYLTFLSSMVLIPTIIAFYLFGYLNLYLIIALSILTFWFILKAYRFYKNPTVILAKKLMLASIIYLPIVQLLIVISFWQ